MKKKKTVKKAASAPKNKAKKAATKPASKQKFVPIGDRVLVKPAAAQEGQVTSFGIILPDSAKEKPETGVVVAVGPGKRGDDNERIPLSVKVGDKVMFSKYGYDEVKVDGMDYFLVREEQILGILN